MEWTNQYNSFNSAKGLTYYENYKQISDWMDGAEYLPPPVEVNLDPIARCNLDCYFCIGQRYLKTNPSEASQIPSLPTEFMIKLVDFLSEWGVRGLCISGGGEPTLHKGLPDVIDRAYERQMDVALVTNATQLKGNLVHNVLQCRWIALSVDAGDAKTYLNVKGAHRFDEVIRNIKNLADINKQYINKTDLCYKFLILPENVQSISDACRLAKSLGVQDFHIRPVDFERSDIEGHKKLVFNRELIEEQFKLCHEMETDDFHVYTVTHKFDKDFHVKHDFTQCLASPLILPILSDGNGYLCVDKKMEDKFKLGSAYPDPEKILKWWGSDGHRRLVKKVNIDKCSRCTWSVYNSQISEVVQKDGMCLSFP